VDGGTSDGGATQATLPDGDFVAISVGGFHACAVDVDGALACFGDDTAGQATPPSGAWTAVAAGLMHTCAITAEGALRCWGDDSYGQASPPAGSDFRSVSAGQRHSCAVDGAGTVSCWGTDIDGECDVPDMGPARQVSAGATMTAAVQDDGTLLCWGNSLYCFTEGLTGVASTSAGFEHVIAHRDDGTVACAGFLGEGRCPDPSTPVDLIRAGAYESCGLIGDALHCWPEGDPDAPAWPPGSFVDVDSGLIASCAVAADGSLACWTRDGSSFP